MNTEDFIRMFGSGPIRALLDWSRIAEPEVIVHHDFHTSLDRLARMHTLWYADPTGRLASYTDPTAAPLTVGQAAVLDMSDVPKRQQTLDVFTERAGRSTEPVQLVLAAYRLQDRRDVLLDGTHRAVAAVRANACVTVFSFVLVGPADPGILPDLSHYLPSARSTQ